MGMQERFPYSTPTSKNVIRQSEHSEQSHFFYSQYHMRGACIALPPTSLPLSFPVSLLISSNTRFITFSLSLSSQ